MRQFNELSRAEQQVVSQRFVLPANTGSLQVNDSLVPFERISGALVGCTVKNDNFHVHGNKQNR